MASIAAIDAKVNEAVFAHERGDYTTAITYLESAAALMIATPDRMFDGQSISWREKNDAIKNLILNWRAKQISGAGGGRSGFGHVPVVRKCS